uniref:mechanosensitive ion channel protein 6-like n=1 Tax=Erigeron canadensis TaxID=72917 RepID=UPI001CB958F5|nr:mechanosensitive ion channel protein 6-like [Erigeron canadensis]
MENTKTPFPESLALHIHDTTTVEFPMNTTGSGEGDRGHAEYQTSSDHFENNNNNDKIQRDSSYNFAQDVYNYESGAFQAHSPITESPGQLSPKDVRVSFNDEVIKPQKVRRRSHLSGHSGDFTGRSEEVVTCSSNAAFKRDSSLMRMKTKSRLMDQPEIDPRPQRTPNRSGNLGKLGRGEVEEDDEFSLDDDLPDEYNKLRYNRWTLFQLASLILIIGALVCTLAIPNFRKKNLYDLKWWKWEVMILVVICGRLVSGWVIRILVFFIERNFVLRKRVLYFVYGLRKAVQNCIWLTLVLIAWECILIKKIERLTIGKTVLPYVTKIWICLLVGTVFWLLKTVLINVLALSFHVSKFFDRIQDSLFNQYVIETLSGPPVIEIKQNQQEEDQLMEEVERLRSVGANLPTQHKENIFQGFRGIGTPRSGTRVASKIESLRNNENGITIDHLHKMNQKNISAWNMNRMMNIINTSMLTTSHEQPQDLNSGDDDTSMHITSVNQAKLAAKKIFCNVAEPGFKNIYLEDLMRFLRYDEALKTIHLFDEASVTKGISKRALKNWLVCVFRERRALALSLSDTKTAVEKLHQMLNVVVGIIIVVIWLLILKLATTQFFIFLSSQLVLIAFVFGNTCKTLFEAVIFLFIMHPFDVGDRCEIDGVQMVVEEMNILTTVFLRYDNQKIAYPNSVLCTMPIANFHRSPDMGDGIDFCIHVSTPAEKVAKMKELLKNYIEKKCEHWQPDPMIVTRDVEDMNRIKMSIWLSHRMNFQDMGERWVRRALLVEEMIKIFKDLDIEYRMLPLDVNVRNLPGLASNRLPSNWTACAN